MAPPVVAFIAGSIAVIGTTIAFKKFVYDPHLSQWIEDAFRNLQARHGWYQQPEEEDEDPYPILTDPVTTTARDESFFGASGDYELRRRGVRLPSLPQEEQWIRAERARQENEERRKGISFGVGRAEKDPFSDEQAVLMITEEKKNGQIGTGRRDIGDPRPPLREVGNIGTAPSEEAVFKDARAPTDASLPQHPTAPDRSNSLSSEPLIKLDDTPFSPPPYSDSAPRHPDGAVPSSPSGWVSSLSDFHLHGQPSHQGDFTSPPMSPILSRTIHSHPISPYSAASSSGRGDLDYGVFSLSSLPSTGSATRSDGLGRSEPGGRVDTAGDMFEVVSAPGGSGSRRTSHGSDSGWTDAEVKSDD